MDEEVFEVEIIPEFAFAAKKFIYDAQQEPVICYDCDAVIAHLCEEEGMTEDEAIDYMGDSVQGHRMVWLHDIDFNVDPIKRKPHLTVVH